MERGSLQLKATFTLLRTVVILLFVFGPLLHTIQSNTFLSRGMGTSQRPLWEVDLSKFGYQEMEWAPRSADEVKQGMWAFQQGVAFTESNVVVAYFIVRDEPSGAKSTDAKPERSDPYRLVAVFLNADRGELIKRLDWPLPSGKRMVATSLFFPASNRRFIVQTGNTLTLYSPKFEILGRYEGHEQLKAIASPAGDTLLVRDYEWNGRQWAPQSRLLDTEDFKVLKSFSSPSIEFGFIWGNEFVLEAYGLPYYESPESQPKELLANRGFCSGYGSFINKDTVAGFTCDIHEEFLLISTEGKIIRELNFKGEHPGGHAVASQDGRRFAVPTETWGLFNPVTPKKLPVHVFNVGDEKPVLTLNIEPDFAKTSNLHIEIGQTWFGWRALALSPEGEMLAVKSGPIVQVYHLPEVGRPSECTSDCNSGTEASNFEAAARQRSPESPVPTSSVPQQLVQEALSWLPADTETVIAANGPFPMPELQQEGDETERRKETSDEVEEAFERIPLSLFGFKHGQMVKKFKGAKVLFSVEGSRNFRPPSELGEGPFQGCAVAVFQGDITERAGAFLRDSATEILRTDQIEGQKVAVFQERLEEDTWTTFVAFPKPNIAVAASSKEYLAETLARMNGKKGRRALPNSLAEWKHVNMQSEFWAVRHYDKKGATTDPTSPFGGEKSANMPDKQAIGLTFQFNPRKSNTATVTYLSGDEKILSKVEKHLFPTEHDPGAAALHIQYRQPEPGVVEGSYDLADADSAASFIFVLEALLGHAIYV